MTARELKGMQQSSRTLTARCIATQSWE